jgi:hypothetical protein
MNSYVGASKYIFLHEIENIISFRKLVSEHIMCVYACGFFFLFFDILKYVFKQWLHMHPLAELDFWWIYTLKCVFFSRTRGKSASHFIMLFLCRPGGSAFVWPWPRRPWAVIRLLPASSFTRLLPYVGSYAARRHNAYLNELPQHRIRR